MATQKTRWGQVEYEEVPLSPSPQMFMTGDQGTALTRCFHVLDGAEWKRWLEDMLGWTELTGSTEYGGGTGLRRFPPVQDTEYPSLYAAEGRFVEGTGPIGQEPAAGYTDWDSVKMEVTFRPLRWSPRDDTDRPAGVLSELWRYVDRQEQFKAEAQPYNVQNPVFKYKGTADPVPENPARPVGGGTLQYVWKQIPAEFDSVYGAWRIPSAVRNRINAALGTINSAAFDGLYPAKTLHCIAPDVQWYFMSNDYPAVDITYQFDRKGYTTPSDDTKSVEPLWDRLLRLNTTGDGKPVWWQIVTNHAQEQGPFETSDFINLFSFTSANELGVVF